MDTKEDTMDAAELQNVLARGETSTVEFKRCSDTIHEDVLQTVCSFANRNGGSIYLGVNDNGTVAGINAERVKSLERQLANLLHNSKLFSPSPQVMFEEIPYKGTTVIRASVPPCASVVAYKGNVYDRVADTDQITNSTESIVSMHLRKQSTLTEEKIYPYLTLNDLSHDTIAQARHMAVEKRPDHPWKTMNDEELLRSAGLYGKDYQTGKSGYRLAAALLFGKPETLRSIAPYYYTDATVRIHNTDRYDDRRMVSLNLLESHGQLCEFLNRYLPSGFALRQNGVAYHPRDIVVRELVSNSLAHREYGNPFPASISIERGELRTKNASRSMFEGRISLSAFTPMPKNPKIAEVFRQVGLAERLGSGLKNIQTASLAYSGLDPEFTDGDIFEANVPIPTGTGEELPNQDAAWKSVLLQDGPIGAEMLHRLEAQEAFTANEIAAACKVTPRTVRRHMKIFVDQGLIYHDAASSAGKYTLAISRP